MRSPATSTPPAADVLAFDLHEAERRSSLSKSTLRRAIAAGELKAGKFGTAGAAIRIRAIDLDHFLRRAAGSDLPAVVPAAVQLESPPQA